MHNRAKLHKQTTFCNDNHDIILFSSLSLTILFDIASFCILTEKIVFKNKKFLSIN